MGMFDFLFGRDALNKAGGGLPGGPAPVGAGTAGAVGAPPVLDMGQLAQQAANEQLGGVSSARLPPGYTGAPSAYGQPNLWGGQQATPVPLGFNWRDRAGGMATAGGGIASQAGQAGGGINPNLIPPMQQQGGGGVIPARQGGAQLQQMPRPGLQMGPLPRRVNRLGQPY